MAPRFRFELCTSLAGVKVKWDQMGKCSAPGWIHHKAAIKVSSCNHPQLKLRSRDFNFQSDVFPLFLPPKALDIMFPQLRLMILIRISSKFSS